MVASAVPSPAAPEQEPEEKSRLVRLPRVMVPWLTAMVTVRSLASTSLTVQPSVPALKT